MWKELKETVLALGGCIIFVVVLAGLTAALNGCAVSTHSPHDTAHAKHPPIKMAKHNKRCKVIGTAKSAHAAVLVERDCLKKGVTTINVVVLNTNPNGLQAAESTRKLIKSIMGFVPPVLKLLFMGKIKKRVYYMLAVGERK